MRRTKKKEDIIAEVSQLFKGKKRAFFFLRFKLLLQKN